MRKLLPFVVCMVLALAAWSGAACSSTKVEQGAVVEGSESGGSTTEGMTQEQLVQLIQQTVEDMDLKGEKGDTGAQGAQGVQGPAGVQGVQGSKGDTGSQGPAGPAGAQGPKGDPGTAADVQIKTRTVQYTGAPWGGGYYENFNLEKGELVVGYYSKAYWYSSFYVSAADGSLGFASTAGTETEPMSGMFSFVAPYTGSYLEWNAGVLVDMIVIYR